MLNEISPFPHQFEVKFISKTKWDWQHVEWGIKITVILVNVDLISEQRGMGNGGEGSAALYAINRIAKLIVESANCWSPLGIVRCSDSLILRLVAMLSVARAKSVATAGTGCPLSNRRVICSAHICEVIESKHRCRSCRGAIAAFGFGIWAAFWIWFDLKGAVCHLPLASCLCHLPLDFGRGLKTENGTGRWKRRRCLPQLKMKTKATVCISAGERTSLRLLCW